MEFVAVIRLGLPLATAILLLSGCGLRGGLERPVPLWGNPPNEGPLDPRTIKAAEEKAKAEAERKKAEEDAARQQQQQTTPATPQ